jgi:hypothetical protein
MEQMRMVDGRRRNDGREGTELGDKQSADNLFSIDVVDL